MRSGVHVSMHEMLADVPDEELLVQRIVWEAERYGTTEDLIRGSIARKGSSGMHMYSTYVGR